MVFVNWKEKLIRNYIFTEIFLKSTHTASDSDLNWNRHEAGAMLISDVSIHEWKCPIERDRDAA